MRKAFIPSIVISLMISACGGGSESAAIPTTEVTLPTIPTTTYTGVFIDSAVEGLTYTIETQKV